MKDWKTTLAGCGGAAAYALATYLQSGKLEVKEMVITVVIAVGFALAKDFNVSGTTAK